MHPWGAMVEWLAKQRESFTTMQVGEGVSKEEQDYNSNRLDAITTWWMDKASKGELTTITDYEKYNNQVGAY
jgi:hypothetical protein